MILKYSIVLRATQEEHDYLLKILPCNEFRQSEISSSTLKNESQQCYNISYGFRREYAL